MGEQPTFAGLGKLYVCRVEEGKEPDVESLQPLGEVMTIKPGMLTYEDDGDNPPREPKGYSVGFNATMEEPSRELVELLTRPTLWDVRLERKPGRMPRKMKKAYRSDYPRNTKWTRKVANYLRRLSHTIHDAEIVVTREQRDRIAGMLDVEMEIRAPK